MPQKETSLEVGAEAPDFELPDQDGRAVSLKGLRGRIVALYFCPEDFTPGCTVEACDFRDNYEPLTKAGAVVLGVSPDDARKHTNFIREHKLPFPLLSDTSHTVLPRYGAWGMKNLYGREYEGVIRTTVLIDRDGKIAHVWLRVKVDGHVSQVLAEVEKLKAAK